MCVVRWGIGQETAVSEGAAVQCRVRVELGEVAR